MPEDERRTHAELQRAYFDARAFIFTQPVPADVEKRTLRIIESACLSPGSRVLDVATGAGVLIPHFLAAGVRPEDITGCDLSKNMLSEASNRYPGVRFWQGDFLDFPGLPGAFQAIFFNACLGNFYNQEEVMARAAFLLASGGRIVISHPMGAGFVAQLHRAEPEIVPHLLPEAGQLLDWATLFSLVLETFVDEEALYIAVLKHRQS